jgi:hypothetical protein
MAPGGPKAHAPAVASITAPPIRGERSVAAGEAEGHGAYARGGGHDEECDDWFTHRAWRSLRSVL